MLQPALHRDIPERLRDEVIWRLKQGGMAELFRAGTIDAINRVYEAGIAAGREAAAEARMVLAPGERWG